MAGRQLLIGTIFPPSRNIPQTNSIKFDGTVSQELMGNANLNTLGVADVWTLMVWLRRDSSVPQSLTTNLCLLNIEDGPAGGNGIEFRSWGGVGGDPMGITIKKPTGDFIKGFRYFSNFPFDVFTQAIFTWNGVSQTLTAYEAGVVAPPTAFFNGSGNMTDTARSVAIATRNFGPVTRWPGFIHSIALWNVDVGATGAVAIFNAGVASTFDLNVDRGSYTFSANLQHWWRLGVIPGDLGRDFGVGSPLIDVDVSSTNIDASDISAVSPP